MTFQERNSLREVLTLLLLICNRSTISSMHHGRSVTISSPWILATELLTPQALPMAPQVSTNWLMTVSFMVTHAFRSFRTYRTFWFPSRGANPDRCDLESRRQRPVAFPVDTWSLQPSTSPCGLFHARYRPR